MRPFYTALLSLCLFALSAQGQQRVPLSEEFAPFLTLPRGYVCYRTAEPLIIDGKATEEAWKHAPETETFVDISGEGFPTPRYRTTARMLWDEKYFYVLATMEEPHLVAFLQQRDTIVYHDNDFEVFIDPRGEGHQYFEIEVNARGTLFDLSLEKPYRSPKHPFVQFQWNCPGLQTGIELQGTLNYSADTDKGWTVEMAIPREAIASEWTNYLRAGNYLRVDFSRVQWQYDMDKKGNYRPRLDANGKRLPEDNWVWSPTGQVAMHMPERWGYVYLSPYVSGKGTEEFRYPDYQPVERFLWMLFYAQERYYAQHKRYMKTLAEFGLTEKDLALLPAGYQVTVEATTHTYEIAATTPHGAARVVNESGCCFLRK